MRRPPLGVGKIRLAIYHNAFLLGLPIASFIFYILRSVAFDTPSELLLSEQGIISSTSGPTASAGGLKKERQARMSSLRIKMPSGTMAADGFGARLRGVRIMAMFKRMLLNQICWPIRANSAWAYAKTSIRACPFGRTFLGR